ncbi:unnamed protein product [Polarella glacialis]|uniref:Tyr recombinase domain-containing protein n=1 Tax=Polarella glacialis TaxID=89957 RepID=A0A813J9X9_POLGL|nr:unnamed protein product [Polarella glacialis]
MIKWIGHRLVGNQSGSEKGNAADRAALNAALHHAFFFLNRAREFCDSGGVDHEQILRGVDVVLKRNGMKADRWDAADEVVVQFRKTKTDQEAFGCTRAHYCSGEEVFCPIKAMEGLEKHFPNRFDGGKEAHLPLFRWSNGKVIRRDEVQHTPREAATAAGLPPERFMSHSLRIGGASGNRRNRNCKEVWTLDQLSFPRLPVGLGGSNTVALQVKWLRVEPRSILPEQLAGKCLAMPARRVYISRAGAQRATVLG